MLKWKTKKPPSPPPRLKVKSADYTFVDPDRVYTPVGPSFEVPQHLVEARIMATCHMAGVDAAITQYLVRTGQITIIEEGAPGADSSVRDGGKGDRPGTVLPGNQGRGGNAVGQPSGSADLHTGNATGGAG